MYLLTQCFWIEATVLKPLNVRKLLIKSENVLPEAKVQSGAQNLYNSLGGLKETVALSLSFLPSFALHAAHPPLI